MRLRRRAGCWPGLHGLRVTDELGPEKAARSSVDDSHREPGVAIRRGDLFRSMRTQHREHATSLSLRWVMATRGRLAVRTSAPASEAGNLAADADIRQVVGFARRR